MLIPELRARYEEGFTPVMEIPKGDDLVVVLRISGTTGVSAKYQINRYILEAAMQDEVIYGVKIEGTSLLDRHVVERLSKLFPAD